MCCLKSNPSLVMVSRVLTTYSMGLGPPIHADSRSCAQRRIHLQRATANGLRHVTHVK